MTRESLLTSDHPGLETLEPRLLLANVLTISPCTLPEGNSGTTPFVFHVTLARTESTHVTVNYSTSNGTATVANNDYVGIGQTPLDFGTDGTALDITVSVNGDNTLEADEWFFVNLTGPVNATVAAPSQVRGTILNEDYPTASIATTTAQPVNEGAQGTTTPVIFTVTLSGAYNQPVTLQYWTVNGTGIGGTDYEAIPQDPPQTLTFNVGDTTKTITTNIIGNDIANQTDRTFNVQIGSPSPAGVQITTPQATATIRDDDTALVTIDNAAAVTEGDPGASGPDAVFHISLSCLSAKDVTVQAATAPGTAKAGSDYVVPSANVTIPAMQSSFDFHVPIVSDLVHEPTQTFTVTLSGPTNAQLGAKKTGTGTILDNDPGPTVYIVASASTTEGNSSTKNLDFTVTLSAASEDLVTVNYATRAGTATSGNDYVALDSNGGDPALSIPAGSTTGKIPVKIKGDTNWEPDETFYLDLLPPVTGATIDQNNKTAVGTIVNDDKPSLSINNAPPLVEGNSGQADMVFTVTLQTPLSEPVTVQYLTLNNTATAGLDYVAISPAQTLTFDPGVTSRQIQVSIIGDVMFEDNETFYVKLQNPSSNVQLASGGQGVGTITDDDPAPQVSIDNAQFQEGDSGTSMGNFTLHLSAPTGKTISVLYFTSDGTAVAGIDYETRSGTATFAVNTDTATISVPIIGNLKDQDDRTFSVSITNPLPNVVTIVPPGQATGTILDDDPPPVVNIDAAMAVDEGNIGDVTEVQFAITLSQESAKVVTLEVYTQDGTATTADDDYVAMTPQTLTFWPGEVLWTVSVYVNGDTTYENDETFFVKLRNPDNATIGNGTGTVTILTDDLPPSLSIDPSHDILEGDSGTSDIIFNVTMSKASGSPTTVDWATANGTAIAGYDYVGRSGTVTFDAGETVRTIAVPVIGDVRNEDNKTFYINLSNAHGATISEGHSQGAATVIDNDPPPNLSIGDVTKTEGNSGTTTATFTVTLSPDSGRTVTVGWATANGTAQAGADYQANSGTLTFTPGQTTKTIDVAVIGDTISEYNETFSVKLQAPAVNANIVKDTGTGTITDDDPLPTISINDAQVTEGNSGTTDMTFTVSLSAASGRTITAHWATADNNAKAGPDYEAAYGDLTFIPSQTTKTVTVKVKGDLLNEDNETFAVNLSNLVDAAPGKTQGTGTILDDDPLPGVSIDPTNVALNEGNSGTTLFPFTVRLSAPSGRTVTVDFTTQNGTATAGTDYVVNAGTLTFQPGDTSKPVQVSVKGDTTQESNETFSVRLTAATNAGITTNQAQGTILNDDTPSLSINDMTLTEGNAGQKSFDFTVTLSPASDLTVTVNYAVAPGTATEGVDYAILSPGTLTFDPGQTTRTISVMVNGDLTPEEDETFLVNLTNPQTATLAKNQGIGTILNIVTDDDWPPIITVGGPAPTYVENAVPAVIDSAAVVTDRDSPDFDTGSLTATVTAGTTADDRLGIRNQGTGSGQIGVSGANVTYAGVTIGTWAGGVGVAPLVVTLNASATVAAVRALAQNITFSNTSEAPSETPRTVQFLVNDGDGATSNPSAKTVNVQAVNDAPVNTVPGAQTTPEDTALAFSAAAGNPLSIADIDIDVGAARGTLTATHGTLTLATTANLTVSGNGTGTVILTGAVADVNTALDGLVFQPTADYNGPATVQITTNDQGSTGSGGPQTDADTVAITVTPVNDQPTATPQAVTTDEHVARVITLAGTDVETPSNQLTFSIVAPPQHGTLGSISGNQVTYTPTGHYNGPDSFTFAATDNGDPAGSHANPGNRVSDPAAVSITVTPVNDKPAATPQSVQVNEDGTVMVTLAGTDVETAPEQLVFHLTSSPQHGSLGALTGNQVKYTPDLNYNGPDSFAFTATDNGDPAGSHASPADLVSDPGTVSITVQPVNDVPSFTKGSDQTVNEDAGLVTVGNWATSILAGPPNEAGQTLTFHVTNDDNSLFEVQPALAADGTLTFKTAADKNGSALVTVTLSDNGGTANEGVDTSAPQTFGITVNPVNDQPTATGQSQTLIAATFIDITLAASDVETAPDQLVYNIVTPPSHGDLTPLGGAAYRYTLKYASYVGEDSFAFTVTDDGDPAGSHSNTGDLTSDPATVNLQVGQKRVFAAGKPAKFTDSNGNLVTVALAGPGSMDFWFAGDGNYDLGLLDLYNTTDKSSLTVTVTPKPKATVKTTTIGTIDVQQGSLGSLTAAAASLTGDLTVSGALGKAAFYDLTGGGTIQIGGTADAKIGASLTFNQVKDTNLSSAMPIASLKAKTWLETDGTPETITAPSLGTLTIAGGLGANLTLLGTGLLPKGITLTTATVSGAVASSTWDVTGLVGKVTLAGAVGAAGHPWELKDATGLASLTAGDVVDAALTVDGNIGAVKAIRWQAGSIQAKSAGSVATTGAKTAGISGDFGAALTLTGTTSTKAGATTLGSAAIAGNVTRGTWDVKGLVGKVTLAGAVGASQPWELKNATGLASLTAGDVVDAALTVAGNIGAITAKRWQAGSIQAPAITSITTTGVADTKTTVGYTGDFIADLILTDAARTTLGKMTIAGWLVTNLTSPGSLGTLTVGGLRDATITVGNAGTPSGIAGLTVKGGVKNQTDALINSNVMAWGDVTAVAVTKVQTSNVDHGHAALGIKARTIKSYMRDKVKHTAPPGSKIVDQDADYTAELI